MEYRFIKEYANYIKKTYRDNIPDTLKSDCFRNIDMYLVAVKRGLVTVSECMESLVNE